MISSISSAFLETIFRVKYFWRDIREGWLYNVNEFFFVHSDLSLAISCRKTYNGAKNGSLKTR